MDDGLIKFIVDLGSIGAICYITYLFIKFIGEQQDRSLEEHKEFLETIVQVTSQSNKDREE